VFLPGIEDLNLAGQGCLAHTTHGVGGGSQSPLSCIQWPAEPTDVIPANSMPAGVGPIE